MSTTAPLVSDSEKKKLAALLDESLRELALIQKANKAANTEIRRLQRATRKSLDRIQEHLGDVQATR